MIYFQGMTSDTVNTPAKDREQRTEQDGKKLIWTKEVNHYSCPSENVKMQINITMYGLSKSLTLKFTLSFQYCI